MHQVRFQLKLRPRPRWGSSQRFPRSSNCISGGPTFKGREGREREEDRGREKKDKKRGGKRRGRMKEEGKSRGRETSPPIEISGYDTAYAFGQ